MQKQLQAIQGVNLRNKIYNLFIEKIFWEKKSVKEPS